MVLLSHWVSGVPTWSPRDDPFLLGPFAYFHGLSRGCIKLQECIIFACRRAHTLKNLSATSQGVAATLFVSNKDPLELHSVTHRRLMLLAGSQDKFGVSQKLVPTDFLHNFSFQLESCGFGHKFWGQCLIPHDRYSTATAPSAYCTGSSARRSAGPNSIRWTATTHE